MLTSLELRKPSLQGRQTPLRACSSPVTAVQGSCVHYSRMCTVDRCMCVCKMCRIFWFCRIERKTRAQLQYSRIKICETAVIPHPLTTAPERTRITAPEQRGTGDRREKSRLHHALKAQSIESWVRPEAKKVRTHGSVDSNPHFFNDLPIPCKGYQTEPI